MIVQRAFAICKNIFFEIYNNINDFNYKYELFKIKKKIKEISFYAYEILPFTQDILLEVLLDNSYNGETLFDVGAYKGKYTLPFLIKNKDNVVVAFEPNHQSFEHLLTNVRCNSCLDRLKAYNIGLSNYDNKIPFYISSERGRSSFSKKHVEYKRNFIKEVKMVPIKALDSIIGELPYPNHIKIDSEGFDLKILQGMKNTISKYRPIIYFEPHLSVNKKTDVERYFKNIGYKVVELGYSWICIHQSSVRKTYINNFDEYKKDYYVR